MQHQEFNPKSLPREILARAKKKIFMYLYSKQLTGFNNTLERIAEKNALAHGKSLDDMHYGIVFRGKEYTPLQTYWDEYIPKTWNLPFLEKDPVLLQEMINLADEHAELEEERYVIDRVLSRALTYQPSTKLLNKYFGSAMTEAMGLGHRDFEMPENLERMFIKHCEKHAEIIDKMQERELANLISLD